MRNVVLTGGLFAALLLGAVGCATPGYTAAERNQQITRNQDYEFKQAVDDWDHVFLLRPASHLTNWGVQ